MVRRREVFFKRLVACLGLLLSDICALGLSFLAAFGMRTTWFAGWWGPMQHDWTVYLGIWPVALVWLVLFAYEGLYPSLGKSFWEETRQVLKSNVAAFVVMVILSFLTKTSVQYSRPVIFLAFLLSLLLLPLLRHWTRALLRRLGVWRRDVILVGGADAVDRVLDNLRRHPDFGLYPVGCFLVDGNGIPDGLRVLGDLDDLRESSLRAEEVLVAMPELPRRELVAVVENAQHLAPVVQVVPDLAGLASAGVDTHDLGGLLLLEVEDRLALRKNLITKRIFDIVCSFLALVILSPLYLILTILVKVDSPGPAFFGHRRVGKDGEQFTCYKFRTMVTNAQEVLAELLAGDSEARAQWEQDFKLKDDPRVTGLGAFLRRTSLDEFPQFWNVLKGDMSLVGPRPIITDELDMYGDKRRYFFKVTPGITGLWQVSGRNDIDYDERVMLDEYYAKNWSLWLDVEILLRTVGVVLGRNGAY